MIYKFLTGSYIVLLRIKKRGGIISHNNNKKTIPGLQRFYRLLSNIYTKFISKYTISGF